MKICGKIGVLLRPVALFATISPTGAVVAEVLPDEREAAYRADADKPRQIA